MNDIDTMEQEVGRLLVESARLRAARLEPDDAHELRHLWAAINAGNSDPCGRNGESCHLDLDAIRTWTAQYPTVVGYGFDPLRPPETDQQPDLTDIATHASGVWLTALVVAAVLFVGAYLWSRS